MSAQVQLDYFYGAEADNFTFFRIPKKLFTDKRYSEVLSDGAKILYGLMLDRLQLSIRNGWFDDQHRAYIRYSVDEIAKEMDCGNQKVIKMLKELDRKQGVGLIESKRIGLGQANIYYVLNFASDDNNDGGNKKAPANPSDNPFSGGSACGQFDHKLPSEKSERSLSNAQNAPESRINTQKCENHISGNVRITSQEVWKSHDSKCENHNSGSVKITTPEMWKSHPNNIYSNDTDFSDTDSVLPSSAEAYREHAQEEETDGQTEVKKRVMERAAVEKYIKHKLSYDIYLERYRYDDKKMYQQTIDLIIDTICDDCDCVEIGQSRIPHEVVRSRFMKLTECDVESVLDKVSKNAGSNIKNMHKYMLTALYRETLTSQVAVNQWVARTMYGEEADNEVDDKSDSTGNTDQYMDFIKHLSEQNRGGA